MSLEDHIDATWTALKERNAKPYDGVNGTLPEWMPQPLQNEFTTIRIALLDGQCDECKVTHTADQVREWLIAYRKAMRPVPGHHSVPCFPIEHAYELRDLAYIQDISDLDSDRGLAAYLGTGADKVYRDSSRSQEQRRIARQRRADGIGRVILRLVREKPEGAEVLPYVRQRLEELQGTNVEDVHIECIEDDNIQWHDARTQAGNTPLSGLKDRVSRALEQLRQETSPADLNSR